MPVVTSTQLTNIGLHMKSPTAPQAFSPKVLGKNPRISANANTIVVASPSKASHVIRGSLGRAIYRGMVLVRSDLESTAR